jgi:mRNA-degrading endonuclease YafQ of YafQ-DinJ toxin-antitoxin module
MYEVIYTGQFKKSLRLCVRRGLNTNDFTTVLDILQEKGELPQEIITHDIMTSNVSKE